jgi:hypothetical protein
MRFSKISMELLLITIAILIFAEGILGETDRKNTGTNLSFLQNSTRDTNQRMDSALWKIYKTFEMDGYEAAVTYAQKRLIPVIDGKIFVNLHSIRPNIMAFNDMNSLIEDIGGATKSINADSITAAIPIDALGKCLKDERIEHASLPRRPFEELIITEGVAVTGAETLINSRPYKTNHNPVKTAIIDVGFAGYESLVGSELPTETTLVSFLPSGGTGSSIHGTACAEVVYDMSPDTILYLMPIYYDTDLVTAVNYCITNDIKVISTSLCFFGAGPMDGTGPINEIMRWAYENGIIWITGAGNYATRHYSGYAADTDSDGWHNFAADDEIIDITITNIPAFSILLDWDDYGTWNGTSFSGTAEDFDLYLYKYENDQWILVETSEDVQDGNDIPYEGISLSNPPNGHYGIAIKRISGNKNVKFNMFIPKLSRDGFTDSQYIVSEQSICNGADSSYAITVGAFNFYDLSLAYYSSWGPTLDGRIKPDISGPTSVSTNSYGQHGFTGTSCATPHVAGAVALIISRLPYTSFVDIFAILTGRAIDEDIVGKDNKWGEGRLYLER